MSRLFTVFGGTGFLGSRIARRLLEDGHSVRIAARRPERDADLVVHERAEPFPADLFEPASLSAALADAHGAVNATSLYLPQGDLTFDAVHVDGAARLARLAWTAGLRRFVHVSGIGSDPGAEDPYIRARGRGEDAVRNAFPSVVVVRPSAMFGPDDALLDAILTTARRLPLFPLFGRGETRLQPVAVDDVAAAIARLLQVEEVAPTYELAGPKVYTYGDLVDGVTRAAGVSVRPVAMPFAVWHGLSAIAERLPGAPLTRSQVALIERDNVAAEGMPGFRDLGISPRDIVEFVRQARGGTASSEPDRRPE